MWKHSKEQPYQDSFNLLTQPDPVCFPGIKKNLLHDLQTYILKIVS